MVNIYRMKIFIFSYYLLGLFSILIKILTYKMNFQDIIKKLF